MPALDGTGPRGQGPLTGRGEGHCVIRLPTRPGEEAHGYAGRAGLPVRLGPRWGLRITRALGSGRQRGHRFLRRWW